MTTKQLLLDEKYMEFAMSCESLDNVLNDLQWLYWFSGKPSITHYVVGVTKELTKLCKKEVLLSILRSESFYKRHDIKLLNKMIKCLSTEELRVC